ncbi:MAG: hypothetical protein JXR94_11480 [Candidatus Hydrogenedentes bacterium]|nr:hypothetical protein [Candidatus Hydrogenedentota bacterium]
MRNILSRLMLVVFVLVLAGGCGQEQTITGPGPVAAPPAAPRQAEPVAAVAPPKAPEVPKDTGRMAPAEQAKKPTPPATRPAPPEKGLHERVEATIAAMAEPHFVNPHNREAADLGMEEKVYQNLRHVAHLAGSGEMEEALARFEIGAAQWRWANEDGRSAVKLVGTDLGKRLLEAGDTAGALRAFSAAGRASVNIVQYLYELCALLDDASRAKLWPERPYLTIEGFDSALAQPLQEMVGEQGRGAAVSALDDQVAKDGSQSAMVQVGKATKEGREWYGFSTRLALSGYPFAIRAAVKEQKASDVQLLIGYAFEAAKQSAASQHPAAGDAGGGWKRLETQGDLYQQRHAHAKQQGYDVKDGMITKIALSLPQGDANTYWLDAVEVYLP